MGLGKASRGRSNHRTGLTDTWLIGEIEQERIITLYNLNI